MAMEVEFVMIAFRCECDGIERSPTEEELRPHKDHPEKLEYICSIPEHPYPVSVRFKAS